MSYCNKCQQNVNGSCPMGMKRIVTKYITRGGKIIYPTNKACFAFCVPNDKT